MANITKNKKSTAKGRETRKLKQDNAKLRAAAKKKK
jgi:hypothetical protein